MKKIYTTLFMLVCILSLNAQTLDNILKSVEQNNHKIIALNKWLKAEEAASRTGILPENPEASYSYKWGSTPELGDIQEFELIQPFRLPGYYNSKADIQKLQFVQKEKMVEKTRQEVLHKVRLTYFNLVWLNKMKSFLSSRKEESQKLQGLMKLGFDQGEISRPAYDKARISAISIDNELHKIDMDLKAESEKLKLFNGGFEINIDSYSYPENYVLPILDSIIAVLPVHSPDLIIAQSYMNETENQVKFERRSYAPLLEAGYKSEVLLEQSFKGIHAGIVIPLWEDRNRLRSAKLRQEYSKASYEQAKGEVLTEVVTLYNEVKTMKNNYDQMKEILGSERLMTSSQQLLSTGQISFPEYLIELQFLIDSQKSFLDTEKAYYDLMSELILKGHL